MFNMKRKETMDSMMKTYGKKKKADEVFSSMEISMKKRKKRKDA